jgi:hypothetical protein
LTVLVLALVLAALQLTHDGRWLTTTDNRNTVRIWDTSKLDAPAKTIKVNYPAEAASYCPSKNRLVMHACICLYLCSNGFPCRLSAEVWSCVLLGLLSAVSWAACACAVAFSKFHEIASWMRQPRQPR